MSRHAFGTAIAFLLLGSAGFAQPPQPRAQTPAPAEKAPSAPSAPAPKPAEAPQPQGQPVNVKLDFTITDQLGTGEPAKRTVTLLVADRSGGSLRSSGNNIRAVLNVDATPQILTNGNIKVQLGLEYNPRQPPTTRPVLKSDTGETVQMPGEGGSTLNQRVAIILVPGKPLILSQAADPLSDRKITVEVRAEILK
jgi:hypothetical protein